MCRCKFHTVLTPPTIIGSVAPYDGFEDIAPYIRENYLEEWLDIFSKFLHIHFVCPLRVIIHASLIFLSLLSTLL